MRSKPLQSTRAERAASAAEYVPSNGWLLAVVSNTGEAIGFLVFQRFLELVAAAP